MTPPQVPVVPAAGSGGLGVYAGMVVHAGFLNWEPQEPIGSGPRLART